MDQERIEECIDELYAIEKKSSERMIKFTEEGRSLIEKLDKDVQRYKQDVTRYSLIYFWLMVVSSVIIIGVTFWLYNSFEKKVNREIRFLEFLVIKVEKVIDKQNGLLNALELENNNKKLGKKQN
jgi:hypothetical protein